MYWLGDCSGICCFVCWCLNGFEEHLKFAALMLVWVVFGVFACLCGVEFLLELVFSLAFVCMYCGIQVFCFHYDLFVGVL